MSRQVKVPKYAQVYDSLRRQIESGRFGPGAKLPSEADLVGMFGASRITVSRALRDLQQAGLVARRVGSGTYVRTRGETALVTLALLVPDAADTDIFEPMIEGLMTAPTVRDVSFVRGAMPDAWEDRAEAAWTLCQQYVGRRVAGVFFAPLEGRPDAHQMNQRIVRAFDAARIPVVLLDRSAFPYPVRGPYDLVGIDNRRAGFMVTHHLLEQGARRIAFLTRPLAAPTVEARRAGYREALATAGVSWETVLQPDLDPSDAATVRAFLAQTRPDAIVCANDRVAADVLRTLLALNVAVPDDVRLAGFDDAEFAPLLAVPLTTIRQPSRQIGVAAAAAMMERLSDPSLPARDIFLQTSLVVRRSSVVTREPGATPGVTADAAAQA